MPNTIPSQILHSGLEPKPPHGHENVQEGAAGGKEGLEIGVFYEGDHEEQEPDGEQQQAGERIGCPYQELVVWGGAEELGGSFDPVREGVDFLHTEHHEGAA